MPRYLVHTSNGMVVTNDDILSVQEAAQIAAPHFQWVEDAPLEMSVYELGEATMLIATRDFEFEVQDSTYEDLGEPDEPLGRQVH